MSTFGEVATKEKVSIFLYHGVEISSLIDYKNLYIVCNRRTSSSIDVLEKLQHL